VFYIKNILINQDMRKPQSFYLSLILFSILIVACSEDLDLQDINEEVLTEEGKLGSTSTFKNQALADIFAPQLRLNEYESYFPSNPEWFVQRTDMRFTRDGRDQGVLTVGRINSGNMNNRLYSQGSLTCRQHYEKSGNNHSSNFFLQIPKFLPNRAQEFITRLGDTDLSDVSILVSRRQADNGFFHIQYWFFYPYNKLCLGEPTDSNNTGCVSISDHEGDWEHITVELDFATNVRRVYFAAHDNEGAWYDTNEILWANDNGDLSSTYNRATHTHPIVYVAKGSHASFPSSGVFIRQGGFANDYTTNNGPLINTWELDNDYVSNCEFFDCDGEPYWLKYSGFWGELGKGPVSGNGPKGPLYQREFFTNDLDNYTIRSSNRGGRLITDSSSGARSACGGFVGDGITFYEDKLICRGSSWNIKVAKSFRGSLPLNTRERWNWENDEIRGVALSNVPSGTKIYLYDDPCGRTNDDWCLITIKRDIEPDEIIVINEGLETTHSNDAYSLSYSRGNNLLGRVSHINIVK